MISDRGPRRRLAGDATRMKNRFETYLDEKAKGKDPAKIRIVLE